MFQSRVNHAEREMKDANLEKATVDGINSNRGIKFANEITKWNQIYNAKTFGVSACHKRIFDIICVL